MEPRKVPRHLEYVSVNSIKYVALLNVPQHDDHHALQHVWWIIDKSSIQHLSTSFCSRQMKVDMVWNRSGGQRQNWPGVPTTARVEVRAAVPPHDIARLVVLSQNKQ